MKASIRTISIFTVLLFAFVGVGCASVNSVTSKAHTATKRVPVKEVKNDPDHIFYIYSDGTVEKQVWTGK